MKKHCIIYTIILAMAACHGAKSQNKKPTQTDSIIAYTMLAHDYKKYILATRWGDNQIARNALYDIIINVPKADSIMFSLAYLYYEQGQYASAALICQELSARDPKNNNYLKMGATSLEAIGALDKALENYEALYLLSDQTPTLYKMAILQYRLKRNAEALTNADIILTRTDAKTLEVEFQPSKGTTEKCTMEIAALNLKGLLYENQKQPKKAIKSYEKALAIDPKTEYAKKKLANLKKS